MPSIHIRKSKAASVYTVVRKEIAVRTPMVRSMVLLFAVLCAGAAHAKKPVFRPVTNAAPVEKVIAGSPLTIRIGDDTSFQVVNATIGPTGQFYPNCTTGVADAGIFAAIGGVLYAPNFSEHPCGTAVGISGVAWTPVSISNASGDGTSANPFTVTVVVDAGSTGVRMTATYTYVDSEPFFRVTKVFTSTSAVSMNVYLGGDIYLAGSDAGVPYLEPLSSAPGGRDCATNPTYTILLIPTTPANHYTARSFGQVWGEINTQGNLSDMVAVGCQDDGAAIQWRRNLLPGGMVTITSAVSFGPIPPIVQFNVTSVSPAQSSCQTETMTVVINGLGFQTGTTFNFGPDITVTSTTINSATQATVTIEVSPVATPGPRNIVGTQSPGGLTATLVNGFTVPECPRCGTLTPVRVLCTTDGSGDYLITFTFQNLSTQTISHLYLFGLPSGVTATPNYVSLSPAVGPGGFATVGPIRIHGAPPGVLTLTAMILNGELEECCELEVRVELPRCDCAQIVESGNAQCRFPSGGYSYTFSYQNLFNGPISQLMITPDVPSTAVYSPNVIVLNPPMQFGETRSFTITITNAPAWQPACFRITSESEGEECCTIRRCLFLPRCFIWPDHDIHYLGDTVRASGPGLTIQSASNRPGVSFDLPFDTKAVDLQWEPLPADLPQGSFIEQRYRGSVGNTADTLIASTRSVLAGANTELHTRFNALNATGHLYEFRNDGRVVGVKSDATDVPPICGGCVRLPTTDAHFTLLEFRPAEFESARDCDPLERMPGEICLFAGYTFNEANTFHLANLKFEADEVRVYPLGVPDIDLTVSAVELEASGPSRISITTLDVRVDCNGNGIDDVTDIAAGRSVDADGNGVPDECQAGGGDLNLSLSTGFDQTHGTLLPGGSSDDDWQVTNASPAGAAKVVSNPVAVWASALPQSAWISVLPDRGDSIAGLTTLQFENCFCIGNGAQSASLDLDVRADNSATVYLNDVKVAGPDGAFNGAPLAVHVTGPVGGDGPFRSGRNCLRVDVSDDGGVTGLDVAGSVRSQNGACP